MALPKNIVPEYTLILPSTKEEITFRPFLVKEEKIFLIAQQSKDRKQLINAVKRIIKSCVKSKTKVNDMSIFDIEYIFLNLRARSNGEIIDLTLIAQDDKETEIPVQVNIEDIEVDFPDEHSKVIELDNGLTVSMRYPNVDSVLKVDVGEIDEPDTAFKMVELCIKEIYEGEEVYDFQSCSAKERTEFIETLTTENYKRILKFFETMPALKHEIEYTNPKTKYKGKIVLEGINDFF